MTHIFYFLGSFALLYELYVVANPIKTYNFSIRVTGKKGKGLTTVETNWVWCMMLYLLWTLIGIFSSQWILFIILLICSVIPKNYLALRIIDAIICSALIGFILINKYHLHINLMQWLF